MRAIQIKENNPGLKIAAQLKLTRKTEFNILQIFCEQ